MGFFVRRITPVKSAKRENELAFPFDIRTGMLAWRELFFSPAFFKPTAGKTTQWNRGAYLSEALGHCSDCHSPRNFMGAIKGKAQVHRHRNRRLLCPRYRFCGAGEELEQHDLAQFLKTGSVPQRMSVFGPMAEVVHDSLAYLTASDLAAMVAYLLDSPPPPDVPVPQKLSPLAPAAYHHAARLYIDNCAPSHQDHGTGIAGAVPPLAGNPAVNCSAVTANASVEPALQRPWLQDFGAQVIQTLQIRTLASKKG